MTASEIRQKYLDFFAQKNHHIIPSASLIPANDSSTLFISSGMQPLIPYLLGEKHPNGQRLVNSQKCIRVDDIEEVGDGRHNTFFEMLGNWSLGDYFKQEQLPWVFEFLSGELKLDPKKLYITVFRGNDELKISRDEESVKIWQELFTSVGLEAQDLDINDIDFFINNNSNHEIDFNKDRIFYYGDKKNWWSRSGTPDKMPIGEIGGGDSEMFYDLGADLKRHENSPWKDKPCHVNCDCGRFIEIGNNVFIEYKKTVNGFEKLSQKNVDFGGGLERITMVAQGKTSIFETDLFATILEKISELSGGQKYADNVAAFEIIADHLKSATFIMGTGEVSPANTDQGYIVRRLLRRAIRYGQKIGIKKINWTREIAAKIIDLYRDVYSANEKNKEFIFTNLDQEEEKFAKTLEQGIARIEKLFINYQNSGQGIIASFLLDAATLFDLYQTYGFPLELSFEEVNRLRIENNGQAISKDIEETLLTAVNEKLKVHQELSRTAAQGKFKGGLADSSAETTQLHTAAHLLLESLKKVLGPEVEQRGANITAERLRFDFSYNEKLSAEQKIEVENLVNGAIARKLPVTMEELPLAEAKAKGASGIFESKYGERVKVYKIGDFSYEICGGPHVNNTSELGKFKIQKEESSSAGVRRIKAVLE